MAVRSPKLKKSPTTGMQEGVDRGLDDREKARMNQKPRSSGETLKGPNDKKASTSRKSGKR